MQQERQTESLLRCEGRALGLDSVRFVRLRSDPLLAERLGAFLSAGWHGDMTWMAETAERRADPLVLWPQARSAIVAGLSYAPHSDPLEILAERSRGAISVYAQGKDYHDILKPSLKRLAGRVAELTGADVRVFVDTAPLMEKPLAQEAGAGWQGKHTNLVSREFGSWLFLGVILTTAELEPDAPAPDHCGSCTRCLDICPTRAFPSPYTLDARRCIAYLTIEHKGPIPREFRAPMGNRVFGCDDCLAVCPWNKFAESSREARLSARDITNSPPLADLIRLDDAQFRARFAGTPVKRTGRDRFVRNVLIAAGNSQDRSLVPLVRERLDDAAALVRGMAVWALRRLTGPHEFATEREQRAQNETDAHVRDEWFAQEER